MKELGLLTLVVSLLLPAAIAAAQAIRLESAAMLVEIGKTSGQWSLTDKASGIRWPTKGQAACGAAKGLEGPFGSCDTATPGRAVLRKDAGAAVAFELVDDGRSLEVRYDGKDLGEVRVLGDCLAVTEAEAGYAIIPCREGLFVPAGGAKSFRRTFGASEYEGCHMNMLGLGKSGSGLIVTWEGVCVFPEVAAEGPPGAESPGRHLTAELVLRAPARSFRLTPAGKGDWNAIAATYRRIAEKKGLAVTLRQKVQRDRDAEGMIGAANVKLWTCLARRMSEDGTKEESVKVRWTFDEAARIAEHIRKDLRIERVLFMIGGWTESGYDCRHPDNLPANPECGGNAALADAIKRIQALGYVASLHDNYQDMYRDARSWDPKYIEKKPDGSPIAGGRWLGGRAYMVCAPMQLDLARRQQNLPGIRKLFPVPSYFIDTTYAVGPRECHDPAHPIGRDEDVAWKIKLSDYAREVFGLFGSECGREWALPHSDFFEGLVGVSGKYFHNLDPASMGAVVIPFWEMVYHDCQICWGKYGYAAEKAAEYVAHHVLCARPLNYHSMGDHLYWQGGGAEKAKPAEPAGTPAPATPQAVVYTRCDGGWAEGLHPTDVFLKNTQEVLGPLHAATAHQRLERLEFLTPDRSLRRATYGQGPQATVVTVNFGPADAEVESALGGKVLLPQWGFVVEGPRLAAFCAKRWGGQDYRTPALFAVQPLDDKGLVESGRIRIYHGFGPPAIRWRGKDYQVPREQVIEPAAR